MSDGILPFSARWGQMSFCSLQQPAWRTLWVEALGVPAMRFSKPSCRVIWSCCFRKFSSFYLIFNFYITSSAHCFLILLFQYSYTTDNQHIISVSGAITFCLFYIAAWCVDIKQIVIIWGWYVLQIYCNYTNDCRNSNYQHSFKELVVSCQLLVFLAS